METIRNPIEWVGDQVRDGLTFAEEARAAAAAEPHRPPQVAAIGSEDIRVALRKGFEDFGAARSDVLFLCLFYPLAGLVLAWLTFGYDTVHLLVPLASGFALVGPVAAVGLYEMSRRREAGRAPAWGDAFGVLASPSLGAIVVVALLLFGLFFLWLGAAQAIFAMTLGSLPPMGPLEFFGTVLGTTSGLTMLAVGVTVGAVFAGVAFALSVMSLPLLIDRKVGVGTALATSIRAVRANPKAMAQWAALVVAGLILGALPLFLGLIVVLPVLGHATWHLYRRTIA
jgi:uncharacterized membrane protein